MMTIRSLPLICLCLVAGSVAAADGPTRADIAAAIGKAQNWFLAQQQDDGSFSDMAEFKLGITLVALDALTFGEQALGPDNEHVARALAFIDQHVNDDGSVTTADGGLSNYCTSLSLMIWARTGAPKEKIEAAQRYLFGLQNTDPNDINEGGIGYGSSGPTHEDLNNTTYAITALRDSGVPADHPAMERAMKFLQRCQNLSEVNDMAWAGNDGSAVYAPHESKAGGSWSEEQQAKAQVEQAKETGKLAGYGSMTYNLICSYIYLQLSPEDPRVQAALNWAKEHYQFDANPGLPAEQAQQGLFYYYQMMAKTFDLIDAGMLTLPDGTEADWRADLTAALMAQATEVTLESGDQGLFWINSASRWWEGSPGISTSYGLKALKRIHASME